MFIVLSEHANEEPSSNRRRVASSRRPALRPDHLGTHVTRVGTGWAQGPSATPSGSHSPLGATAESSADTPATRSAQRGHCCGRGPTLGLSHQAVTIVRLKGREQKHKSSLVMAPTRVEPPLAWTFPGRAGWGFHSWG